MIPMLPMTFKGSYEDFIRISDRILGALLGGTYMITSPGGHEAHPGGFLLLTAVNSKKITRRISSFKDR